MAEDDGDLRELLRLAGEKRSYRVASAADGLEARRLLLEGLEPDLVVLDINMPGLDGFGFCRWLREDRPRVPVIFLSSRAEEYDKLVALEIGGDDYLTKPFSTRELFARVAVALRRVRLFAGEEGPAGLPSRSLASGDLRIDPDRWLCEYRGARVVLTVSEFRILHRLLSSPGAVLDRGALAEAAFPDDEYNSGRSVDVHVCRIRRKLQAVEPGFDGIETVHQVGYRWRE